MKELDLIEEEMTEEKSEETEEKANDDTLVGRMNEIYDILQIIVTKLEDTKEEPKEEELIVEETTESEEE